MSAHLPPLVPIVFGSTVFAILGYFFSLVLGSRKNWIGSSLILLALAAWLALQGILSGTGFYLVTDPFPPRFLCMVVPPVLFLVLLFIFPSSRTWMDQIPGENLTYLHLARIPVELVLYWLAMYGWVPISMTFAGWNFDILIGLTAPIAAYFILNKPTSSKNWILFWNIVGLLFLLNIVILGILSAPGPFQKLSFERPNTAVLQFPYVWLPSFIVPSVLFAHLVSIRRRFVAG
ncbi:hypothetical protein [Leptospira dzoumogneensis]|uniref:Uncharacterized protein n=1 Tax=Leptospira dzoumogneensis TaxID=2484904 RepID=A0A4Z1A9C8_9LEPT|nr:hypothetical protein [Leptospira dzoumogneensis]TGM97202.1 hypothetical protein EHR06_13645 [Leptospira dzoumogneensis]